MQSRHKEKPGITEQAAGWLVRLEEDTGPQCRAAFTAWLKYSPRHVEEFLLVEAAYSKLDGIDPQRRIDIDALLRQDTAQIIPLREDDEPGSAAPSAPPSRPRRALLAGLAAVLAIAVVSIFLVYRDHDQIYATDIGEQRSVKLDDGSVMYLNTRSRVAVSFSRELRGIRLLEGEALFTVAHDTARPFRVTAGTAVVQAVGTQFDVYRRHDATLVSVVEGKVKVFAPSASGLARTQDLASLEHLPAPLLLAAGEEARVSSGRIVKRASDQRDDTIAWRQRLMVFRGDTLAEVAEQVNRYNRLQILIADPGVAARRLSGTFNVDDLQALLAFLSTDGDLVLDYDQAAGRITIRANPAAPRPGANSSLITTN